MNVQTAPCPACPAWMVRRPTGAVLTSNPPQYPMEWWCGCGHREPAGADRMNAAEDEAYGWWRAVNRQREHEEEQRTQATLPWWKRLFR